MRKRTETGGVITGEQIREARQLLGWSMHDLAHMARRTYMSIRQAENNELPNRYANSVLDSIERQLKVAGIKFSATSGQIGIRPRQEP